MYGLRHRLIVPISARTYKHRLVCLNKNAKCLASEELYVNIVLQNAKLQGVPSIQGVLSNDNITSAATSSTIAHRLALVLSAAHRSPIALTTAASTTLSSGSRDSSTLATVCSTEITGVYDDNMKCIRGQGTRLIRNFIISTLMVPSNLKEVFNEEIMCDIKDSSSYMLASQSLGIFYIYHILLHCLQRLQCVPRENKWKEYYSGGSNNYHIKDFIQLTYYILIIYSIFEA